MNRVKEVDHEYKQQPRSVREIGENKINIRR